MRDLQQNKYLQQVAFQMSQKIAQPLEFILNSELSGVLSSGFAELYRVKPDFPVTYLGNWLKKHSDSQKQKKKNVQNRRIHHDLFEERQREEKQKQQAVANLQKEKENQNIKQQSTFTSVIENEKYLEDLLCNWVPQYIQQRYKLAGCYVGQLTHPHKSLELHNFQPGAQFDSQSPKIIEYVGTSNSQKKTMHMKVLPSESGISYPVFNDPEPEPEDDGEEKQKKEPKKTYLYVPDVTKDEKVFYFKYPKLGSYACFPLKLKSFLIETAFDQGYVEYKEYLKNKEEAEKLYGDQLNEARQQYEDLKKKFDEMEIPEEQPNESAVEEKKNLQQEVNTSHEKLTSIQNNPPVTPLPNFGTVDKMYLIGCDTLGQDEKIPTNVLDDIDKKAQYYKKKFQEKERQMLLDDILAFLEDEGKLQANENLFKEYEKSAISQSEEAAKEKTNKQKEVEFEISVGKCKKMEAIFSEPQIQKSMETYLNYNIPKYQQIYQIALMLLGYPKDEINLPRKNVLNFRKVKNQKFIEEFLNKLCSYELRRQSSEAVNDEYKINKLLERIEKIDFEQVSKYNTFIWALACQVKFLCWARLHCKDAKVQAHEASLKAKQQRQQEIVKFDEEFEKAVQSQKAESGEEFNEEDFRANYLTENKKPTPLEVKELESFLDIE